MVWAVGRPEVCCTQEPLKFDPGEVFDEAWSLMEKEFFDPGLRDVDGEKWRLAKRPLQDAAGADPQLELALKQANRVAG